ncbi:MAG: DUF177 domain-containing protein [Sideroxydans sp.]|nr:DUF177 domain-containing protein [Sideroxydans sp.]
MFAQPLIDALEFARNGKQLRGEVPISALSRLGDLLTDSRGMLHYAVHGYRVGEVDMLGIEISGECHLRCQRCLGELNYPLTLNANLRLVSSAEMDEVEAEDEVEYLEASSQLDVLALVEDELLLSLPFSPKHATGVCVPAPESLQHSANPFSVLAALKK